MYLGATGKFLVQETLIFILLTAAEMENGARSKGCVRGADVTTMNVWCEDVV